MKKTIIAGIFAIVAALVGAGVSFLLTQSSIEQKTVETLAGYFDFVDQDMLYKQALQTVYEDSQKIKAENEKLKSENSELNKFQIEIKNAFLITDGLKKKDEISKSVAIIDSQVYYSDNVVNQALGNKLFYSADDNAVFYNTTNSNIKKESKIDLFSTQTLYDGNCYFLYTPSEGETFSMGSGTYNKGFVLGCDHSIFGAGDGYALFDLQKKYSKMSFDVGRTNEYSKEDVILKVYLNNEYSTEYKLNAQSPPKHLSIDLSYANNLKLEITGGSRVKYGFVNVILEY